MGKLEKQVQETFERLNEAEMEAAREARAGGASQLSDEQVLNLLHDAVGELRGLIFRLARELDDLRDS